MNDGDELLVRRSRAGDRRAFEELVRRTARGLYCRIYLQIADRHRTEDLVQETYLRAWQKLDSLSDEKMFRGWINAIAQSVVIDAARRQSRKKRGRNASRDEQAMRLLADDAAAPSESMERDEQRREVLSVLGSLPEEYRDVLMLRYIAGADYETISRQLAITNGSLRGLLNRGMKLLRERMRQPADERPK